MPLRGRSQDRHRKVTPLGPSYMSNDQFANYLAELRNNRTARPSGARPQPPSQSTSRSIRGTPTPTQEEPPARPSLDYVSRTKSAMPHRRAQSALSTYSSLTSRTGRALLQEPVRDSSPKRPLLKPSEVVPSGSYIERGQRWMEKEEAVSLRDAMEDMDFKKQEEEERLFNAAQEEASELVWQHQNPVPAINPHAPYGYKDHLRKNSYQHARTQSAGPYTGVGVTTGLGRDVPRSVSGGSTNNLEMMSHSRVSSGSSEGSEFGSSKATESIPRSSVESTRNLASLKSRKPHGSITKNNRPEGARRIRSSGKRNISGELSVPFTGEQIWEETEEESTARGRSTEAQVISPPLRVKARDPLNRVQFVQDIGRSSSTPAEPTKTLYRSEIHRNPPSQSRNPAYMANSTSPNKPAEVEAPVVQTKDGLEIRSEEIRQATSMRLKDRSPKLPTPTVVSDKPGRPIVSFDANWRPSEADIKPEERRKSPFKRQNVLSGPDSSNVTPYVPTIQFADTPSIQVNPAPSIHMPPFSTSSSASAVPTIYLSKTTPTIPVINRPDEKLLVSAPTINLPDSCSYVPTINFPHAPDVSVSAPINSTIRNNNTKRQSTRPLPDPKTASSRPLPQHHATSLLPRGHWSPAGRRATATCHQCQLPIEGRVVGLREAQEKYHPHCFICFTCGTGLEALEVFEEHPIKRAERLDRIERRSQGESLPEIEGMTCAEDGDSRLRYFCHLDWHEIYAPKCKHCKTSILGEHMIALGEHWHFGHFFCAECGDPFEKGMSHIEKDGYAWCIRCQTKRTERRAPKCNKCRLPVIGEAVQAMGGEWHNKCFSCVTCKGDFPDGCFFPKEVGQETVVICTRCMEMELKA
ncbi:hypothetical protein BJ878DRAFT_549279 [Calycina marina]|uniref:LIM zinc-binding domain-containing protein n=1 Tax=Calycina marina TaxID=1763456 RepID=A0A9P7ZAS7_9HELO|nr:hypothetical protein BJ878DRAFT_549279 [Calycina marina]